MNRVLIHEETGFDRIATKTSYIFGFREAPEYDTSAVPLGDGSFMYPGERFTKIGGRRTAAGYRKVDLVDGYLEYVGLVHRGEFQLLCFDYYVNGQKVVADIDSYERCHFGFLQLWPKCWMFSTPGVAARIVETTRITRIMTEG